MTEQRHVWGLKMRIAAAATVTGCDQTEQRCWNCALVKIRIHPPHGRPYVVWRFPKNPQQFTNKTTPLCQPVTGLIEARHT